VIGDFHFLRPEWLLAVPAAGALVWLVSRREDVRRRWRGTIAPHLLDHLVVERRSRLRLRPVHLTALLIALGGLAAAGPTWDRERPPFVEDKAPLALAIDLSATMDAIDVTPTRLERTKLKVRDLLALRAGARTAVFAYAGDAHMVLPLTDDTALIQTYVDSLATGIMPVGGKDTARALAAVAEGLAREETPGTILFLTDGVEPRAFDALKHPPGKDDILVLGVGTPEGGPVKTGPDSFLADATGRRVFARLDVESLRRLRSETGAPVATITQDDADIRWIQRRVQSHLQQKQADAASRWNDRGWWLTIPIALLGAAWFRRGWTIRWIAVALLALAFGTPGRAEALEWRWLDPWLTANQQGRFAYDRGDYKTASERFEDPMWRGAALYREGRYEDAVEAFARVDTAQSYYNQGNALARLGKFPAAVASYRAALERRPDWPEARANLAIVQRLIPKEKKDDEEQGEPNEKPDQIQFDDKGKKGKAGRVDAAKQTAEMWMRNIQTTPRDLLRRKFALEAGPRTGTGGAK
jgi:Ca-activated chloride channel family protein